MEVLRVEVIAKREDKIERGLKEMTLTAHAERMPRHIISYSNINGDKNGGALRRVWE
jgi:hypothetical protein